MRYKYKLRDINKTHWIDVPKMIAQNCDVSIQTAYNYINTKAEERFSIPSDHLRIIASILNMTMEDLFTEKVQIHA